MDVLPAGRCCHGQVVKTRRMTEESIYALQGCASEVNARYDLHEALAALVDILIEERSDCMCSQHCASDAEYVYIRFQPQRRRAGGR